MFSDQEKNMRACSECLGVLFLAAVLAPAFAEQGGTAGGQKGELQGPRFNAARFIKDFDKDGNGKLSREEAPPALRSHFEEIDTNKDGELNKQELEHHAARMAVRRPAAVEMLYIVVDTPETEVVTVQDLQRAYDFLRKLDRKHDGKIDPGAVAELREYRVQDRADTILKDLDRNNDGKISRDEARGILADEFDQIDTNKDGFLDKKELQKALTPVPEPDGTRERSPKLQEQK
jgi:Ca2+-binding EF-hand superfamily protein